MLRSYWFLLLFCLVLPVAGCQQSVPETTRLGGATMGTTWSVILPAESSSETVAFLTNQLQDRLDQINRLMSTYDPDSELSKFNDQASTAWFPISPETLQVMLLSQEISALSGGAFDVSVGPLVDLWGFGAAPREEQLPTDLELAEALARIGYRNIEVQVDPPAVRKKIPHLRIDLSAVAKGYAVDALAVILRDNNLHDFLVEVGGELQVSGMRDSENPWRIAIEKPLDDSRQVETVFQLSDVALATSGNYRNFYLQDGQRYAHTINPLSGRPILHKLASATVLDPSCARADALATALMVMGEERARNFCETHRVAAYLLIHDNEATGSYMSTAFKKIVDKDRP
ncbi:MAG: FAD:protein FMN transferase [Desulfuromonadales bacterium]|nr:FAD:protein FMN transferase [Desulfuromonadales bacterium]MBN2793621.1 FAD:protein FMN transferase [Desulfuromonadales bacterium]